jgi:hypothetical protein
MNLLMADPAGRGRPELLPGDRAVLPGAFAVTYEARNGTKARLRFSWVDRTKPKSPRRLQGFASEDGFDTDVSWDQSPDLGSGVGHYLVTVDGKHPTVATEESVALSLMPGAHVVAVVAVDRAGNRSAAARLRLVAR